jgi:hypothetical protein
LHRWRKTYTKYSHSSSVINLPPARGGWIVEPAVKRFVGNLTVYAYIKYPKMNRDLG